MREMNTQLLTSPSLRAADGRELALVPDDQVSDKYPDVDIDPRPEYGDDIFILLEDLLVEIDGEVLLVPAGFRFNGASTGWVTSKFIHPASLGMLAVAVHDFLYHHKGEVQEFDLRRRKVDKLFRRHMQLVRVPEKKRKWAYRIVRALGWWAWWT